MPYADFENPQSLNLYAYVGNNPLSTADDDGHDRCDGANGGSADECQNNGGSWIPGNVPRSSQPTTSSPTGGGLNWDQVNQGVRNIVDVSTQATHDVINWISQPRDPGCMAASMGAGSATGAVAGGVVGLAGAGVGEFALSPAGAGIGAGVGYAAGVISCMSGNGGGGGSGGGGSEGGGGGAQDKKLTAGEIKKLKDSGIDPEELKREVFPGGTGKTDLYKTSSGEIVVKGKGGIGAGEPTDINIKNLK